MSTNRKGRTGWHQATLKASKICCNFTDLVTQDKDFIVTLAFWGWLPPGLGNWLDNTGVPRDE